MMTTCLTSGKTWSQWATGAMTKSPEVHEASFYSGRWINGVWAWVAVSIPRDSSRIGFNKTPPMFLPCSIKMAPVSFRFQWESKP
jgi:hypothetical protein